VPKDGVESKENRRHTQLQPYNDNSIVIEDDKLKKGRKTEGSRKKKKSKKDKIQSDNDEI
jgi:hypothetical protein